MIAKVMPELESKQFKFKRRGAPLPADRRPAYRIALLLLLLEQCSRGGKSSLPRLQILDWAARDDAGFSALMAFLDGDLIQEYAPVRLDPAFIRALNYGVALRLVTHTSGRVRITEEGRKLFKAFSSENDVSLGGDFAQVLGKKFLENQVRDFLERRQ